MNFVDRLGEAIVEFAEIAALVAIVALFVTCFGGVARAACPQTVIWDVATGVTVIAYEVEINGEVQPQTPNNHIEACFSAEGTHSITVTTIYDLDGVTTRSASSSNTGTLAEIRPPGWEPPPTPTPTATPTAEPTPLPRPPDAVCADMAGGADGGPNGVVGMADFGRLILLFGKHNDGRECLDCQ